jgi:hypothetical protein
MSLFWQDWLALKDAINRHIFNHDMRFQGMTYEQALPYLTNEVNKLTVVEFESYIKQHGIKREVKPCQDDTAA